MENSPVDLDRLIAQKLQQGTGIYRPHIARAIREIPKPDNIKDFRMGIAEIGPSTLGVSIWENQVKAYSDEQRGAVMSYVKNVKTAIELNGLSVEYIAQEGDPPARRE
jgi:hypothetical protein